MSEFQSYTISTLNETLSTTSDMEQYKLLSVKETPLANHQQFRAVLCFPVLFLSGRFGEFYPRSVKISSSEYGKPQLLNEDSRFRKDPKVRFLSTLAKRDEEAFCWGVHLLKGTCQGAMLVQVFLDKLSKSNQDVQANLSTVFLSKRGSKQYWFLRSSELPCMLREWGTPTLFLTLSCSE